MAAARILGVVEGLNGFGFNGGFEGLKGLRFRGFEGLKGLRLKGFGVKVEGF